jgi:polyhydroxyalkanoate synthesis regulator phasin
MRVALIALSTIALIPSAAFAQTTCEQRSNQVVGTVLGGAAGAALGSVIAGKGHKDDGAIVGALGGAVLGSQIGKPRQSNCAEAYGYYDNSGAWHTTSVERNRAQGFYDRDGRWVAGAPNGYYDSRGVWVTADAQVGQGYYDDRGRWVPPSVNGYYDPDNRWIAADTSRRNDWAREDWTTRADWRDRNVHDRADMLRQRIIRAENEGRISHREARAFLDDLRRITVREARMPHRRGELNYKDQRIIEAQLQELSTDFRQEMRG